MYYGTTTEATDWPEDFSDSRFIRVIYRVFHFLRANPDIEDLYPKVRKWMVECSEDGWPQREIAFDKDDNVLFCTPNQRNTGFWTDMGAQIFEEKDLCVVDKSDFERYWGNA